VKGCGGGGPAQPFTPRSPVVSAILLDDFLGDQADLTLQPPEEVGGVKVVLGGDEDGVEMAQRFPAGLDLPAESACAEYAVFLLGEEDLQISEPEHLHGLLALRAAQILVDCDKRLFDLGIVCGARHLALLEDLDCPLHLILHGVCPFRSHLRF